MNTYALLLIIPVCWVFTTSGTEIQTIAPHCSDKCGNISIPYPFGIEDGCYFEDFEPESPFKIKCNNPPTPILDDLNLEVLNISVIDGELRTKLSLSYDCYYRPLDDGSNERRNRVSASLSLKRFILSSTKNILVAIGCDTYAWFSGFRYGIKYKTGCMTSCVEETDVYDDECTGIGCCQASIPRGINRVEIQVSSLKQSSAQVSRLNKRILSVQCSAAFAVEKDAFTFYKANLSEGIEYYRTNALPVVLQWTIGTNNCSVAKGDPNYLCKNNTQCYDPVQQSGYRCKCKNGFSGNPYLPLGCTDINECEGENECKKPGYCINTKGSYYCKCPKGYHGNGTLFDRCIPNTNVHAWVMPVLASAVSATLAILLLVGGWWLYSVIKKRQATKQRQINFERNGGMLLKQQNEGIVERIKIFTIDELEKATDNFNKDRILGRGGHGTVYKGMLDEGKVVAVKKSNKLQGNQGEEFINEVVVLSQINHRNILKLLGCCLETEVPLLVYEFIPNGTLFDHIHNPSEDFPITWKMRLQIASDSAGALAYLHSSTSFPIFHRDIKSSNILLDDKYRAKLSDFGTSRSVAIDQTHVVTRVMGTFGYLDPEYYQTQQFTEKSDVYSFGVVLVELLTAQKAIRPTLCEDERSLTSWFLSHVEDSSVLDIIDSQVLQEGSKEEVMAFADLAKRCLNIDGKRRPTMKGVLLEIEVILSRHVPPMNMPISEQVCAETSKSVNSSTTFSLESRVLDSAELSLLFNPR